MITERINEANAKASGKIAIETINKHIDSIAKKYTKTMKLDGFRKGKVPVHIVKTRYKDNLLDESKQQSINEFFKDAIKALNVDDKDIIGQPLLSKFEEVEGGIEIELMIGLRPDFSVEDILTCIPSFTLEKITDEKVDERLEQLAKNRAPVIPSEDKELKSGHIAHIDFEGFLNGEAFDGGKAQNFDLTIGSNQFIPGFEDALIGMNVGDEKMIDVTFPENYQAPNLAGQAVQFNVKLHAIKQKDSVVIDDSFAKAMLGDKEENTLETLKEQIKKDLENEAKMKLYNEKLKEEALENIAKHYNFDLPENILEQEIRVLVDNELSKMKEDEILELNKNKEKGNEFREAQRDKAKTSVKVTFIIDQLAKQEKISVDDNEVFQTLYYESMMNGQNPQAVIEYYQKNNLLPAIKMAIIEDKVITHLLDKHNGIK